LKAIFLVGKKNIGEEKGLAYVLEGIFDIVTYVHSLDEMLVYLYSEPPDMILVDSRILEEDGGNSIKEFRESTAYGDLPVVAVVYSSEPSDLLVRGDVLVDDFVVLDNGPEMLQRRIKFILSRRHAALDTNPLTRLPGNESIIRHIQAVLDEGIDIAIAWVDIDNFKPFNDKYGFSTGDEVILATARIITNTISEHNLDHSFVGHIGGDDFVFICPIEGVRKACEDIITKFDMIVRNFYNDDDLKAGEIISKDRVGKTRRFKIMSISIAVILNQGGRYRHYGEVSSDITDIKKYIKALDGSNYMIDRRAV